MKKKTVLLFILISFLFFMMAGGAAVGAISSSTSFALDAALFGSCGGECDAGGIFLLGSGGGPTDGEKGSSTGFGCEPGFIPKSESEPFTRVTDWMLY